MKSITALALRYGLTEADIVALDPRRPRSILPSPHGQALAPWADWLPPTNPEADDPTKAVPATCTVLRPRTPALGWGH